jgi:hypothetical protein
MFSLMFLLFMLLLSYSSIFAKLLLTNFFTPFSAARGSNFSSRFLYHWHSKLVRHTCAPMFLAQNKRGGGVLEARCSCEPGSSLTPGEFSPFCLLLKVSGANVCWTERESYISYSKKSLN